MIYHITSPQAWQEALKDGIYVPAAFAQDGFIHCSDFWQLKATANRFYLETPALIVLEINHHQTQAPVVYENLEGGPVPFPHLYGPLPCAAVESIFELQRDPQGHWTIPASRLTDPIPPFNEIPFGLPGKAYRSVMPCHQAIDPKCEVFEAYRRAGVQTVYVLQEAFEPVERGCPQLFERYQQMGLRVVHAPSPDLSIPAKGTWNQALADAAAELKEGRNIAIHCHAGLGRTGIFAACLAVDLLEIPAAQAISWVRQYSPYAVETLLQENFVEDYARSRA